MRFRTLCMLALTLATAAAAHAETRVGVNIQIGDAPPPPVIVVHESPHVMYVPEARVYVANDGRWDYDWFRSGMYWYIWDDGYWFRATSWRGPYRVIETRYVPAGVWRVPNKHWKHPHGGPPGQMKKAAAHQGKGRRKH